MKFYLALIGLLLAVTQISAQQSHCDIIIYGRILDSNSGKGLPYATIQIDETVLGTVSDSLGAFVLPDLCAEMITLNVSHLGCTPISKTMYLRADTTLVFYMDHSDHFLNEVEIRADANTISAERN